MKKPTVKEYREAYVDVMSGFAPSIHPCRKCKWPVASGWCCTFCGGDEDD